MSTYISIRHCPCPIVPFSFIDDFQVGDSLMVTKLGYMADRHTTKWIVVNPPYHFDEKEGLVI